MKTSPVHVFSFPATDPRVAAALTKADAFLVAHGGKAPIGRVFGVFLDAFEPSELDAFTDAFLCALAHHYGAARFFDKAHLAITRLAISGDAPT